MTQNTTCSFPGCVNMVKTTSLCGSHRAQLRRGKSLTPIGSPKVPAADRFWAKVEKTEGCWNWTGSKLPNGYGKFFLHKKLELAHRAAWLLFVGGIPDAMFLDHICRNKACVNPDHLRLATNKQNNEYLSGPHRDNRTSGVRGVYWNKAAEKWMATVGHNGKKVYVGVFDDLAEAESAVRAKRAELFTFPEN